MNRGYNFGAGPAMLPLEILEEAQTQLLNWQGLGMSVMEIGHRTEEFKQLLVDAEVLLRSLLNIPENYHVLFLGGPARLQFGMIPLNLLTSDVQKAGYLVTGTWSLLAFKEACRVKKAYCIASSEEQHFLSTPLTSSFQYQDNTSYLYYTPNETIQGVRCSVPPEYENTPLIADMTSCLLTEPINVSDYGLIFAGAQKNIANAGLTIVIMRDDLLPAQSTNVLTTMLDYRTAITTKSLYATPPTFNCYLALKMFQWIAKQGGVEALYKINCEKASRLYEYIDASSFYKCQIAKPDRSLVNICFKTVDESLEESFLLEAKKQGLFALKGHISVGGLRASLYNSMPLQGVERLIDFMDDFAK